MLTFRNQYVRDLAWALSSPPLMHVTDTPCSWYRDAWYCRLYQESIDWLQQLDRDQAPLALLVEQERDRRLGRYFELLWAFWFRHSGRFDVVAENIQIEHEGRTTGELDLVVHERATGRNIHIELAVKFYLGLGDTRQPANWYGPGKKDRLDIKMDSLVNRQSVQASRQHVREQLAERGIEVDACAVILKGRLFYPHDQADQAAMPENCNPTHLRSHWLPLRDIDRMEELDYLPLQRRGWLAGAGVMPGQPVYSRRAIHEMLLRGELGLPLCVTGYRKHEEKIRLFVVPDDWSTTL